MVFGVVKFIETENRMAVARGWGRVAGGTCGSVVCWVQSFSLRRGKEFWRWMMVWLHNNVNGTVHLKIRW